MQIHALDNYHKLISAKHSVKHQDYYCLECQGIVRLRSGLHRQRHFYHLDPSPSCRQNGKSMVHLQIQWYLQRLLPKEETQLEYRFKDISRIADVIWHTKKIIFEVQCSPITAEEVKKRNEDYSKQGYQVIWILHDQRYNQWRMSAAEMHLQGHCYYYSNINAEGQGTIYDQFHVVKGGIRTKKLGPLHIECSSLKVIDENTLKNELQNKKVLTLIKNRLSKSSIYFQGDLVDHSLSLIGHEALSDYLEEAFKYEKQLEDNKSNQSGAPGISPLKIIFHYIMKSYDYFIQILLERACK